MAKKPITQKPPKPKRVASKKGAGEIRPQKANPSPKKHTQKNTKHPDGKKQQAQKPKARPRGRPTDYRPEFAEQAFNLTLIGAVDVDLASFFNTTHQTIDEWKHRHPDFAASIKRGKEIADGKVGASLYQRACGYEYVEEQAFKIKLRGGGETVKVVQVHRKVPPETLACIYWLNNRQRYAWRQKIEPPPPPKNSESTVTTITFKMDRELKEAETINGEFTRAEPAISAATGIER